jgi:hypothetical protein
MSQMPLITPRGYAMMIVVQWLCRQLIIALSRE